MPEEIEGTVRDLYRLRQAGMDTTTLAVTYEHLNETVVLVPVPCLICKKVYRQPAAVREDGLPYAVLCSDCDAKITAEGAAAVDKPRRKRRTKAQIEADRLAAGLDDTGQGEYSSDA